MVDPRAEPIEITYRVLVQAHVLAEIVAHVPWVSSHGESCDERGCWICNAGAEAIDQVTDQLIDGPNAPGFWELKDSMEVLAAWLEGDPL